MFAFLSLMWTWLPQPLPILFYVMFLILIVIALVSAITYIIDLIPWK